MATIGSLLIELSANVARLENDLGRAAAHVHNTERMVQQSVNRMNGFFGLLGVSLSGAAMIGFVKNGIDAQDMLATLSERTGTAVDELAGLKYAAEQNATSLDAVANAGKKLATGMADNPELFRKLGINAKTSTEAMIQMADIFATMPDGVNKTALAVKLMGKSGEEMIPFLNQGSASLRKFIEDGKAMNPVTAQSAARAKEFNDQLNTLSTSAHGFSMEAANYVLPNLVKITTAMADTARDAGLLQGLLVGVGGVFAGLLTDDLLDREQKIVKKMDYLRTEMGRNIDWGTGFGLFGMGEQTKNEVNTISAELIRLEKELDGLQKQRAAAEKKKTDKPKTTPPSLANSTDGMQVLKALELDYQNVLARRADAMNYPLLSASERALAEDLRTVHDSASKSRVELEKLNVSGKLSAGDYKLRLQELIKEEENQVESVKRMRAAQDELNSSWQYGAKSAMRSYLDEVENVSKQSEALFGKGFKGMEDALVSFVQTGKMDFASLRDSIIADLIRIQIRANMMPFLLGLGQSAADYVGGLFSGGSSASAPNYIADGAAFGTSAQMFADGGAFSNQLYSSPTPFQFASGGGFGLGVMGEAGPEAVMPLTRGSDGKLGVRAQGGGGGQVIVHQPINIDARGADAGIEQRIRAMMPGLLAENQRVIVATVQSAVEARGRRL